MSACNLPIVGGGQRSSMVSAATVKGHGDVGLRLVNHQVSMGRLIALMNRVRCFLEPKDFIEAVSLAFKEVQAQHVRQLVSDGFRTEASFLLFQKAVRLAREVHGGGSVMVLGCGRGFAGESSEFAAQAIREILSADQWKLDTCDISPLTLSLDQNSFFSTPEFAGREQGYDLVVAHSLLHFIPDVTSFFRMLCRLLKPVGGIILGHEPNAAFWQNKECQSAVKELRMARRTRGLVRQLTANQLFRRLTGQSRSRTMVDKVNQKLMERNGFAGLTSNEMSRLVDVHRPEAIPGQFRIGFDGFDLQELTRSYLPGFSLFWAGTSAHLGYISSSSLSPEWLRREASLAENEPLAGSVLNAYWRTDPHT
jgi:SAM-dependent methyltransferase